MLSRNSGKPIVFLTGVTTYEGEPENPRWAIVVEMPRLHTDCYNWETEYLTVTKCPFCQSSMPELILKENPPSPMQKISDGGYYCDTCEERLLCCRCHMAESKYEVKTIR